MNLSAFNWIDWIILGVLAFSTLVSFSRGFIREAISLATWILATWVAYKYGHLVGGILLAKIELEQARTLIGAAILFFTALILGASISYSMTSMIRLSGLSIVDRTLGMAFGLIRGGLLICVLMIATKITHQDEKNWWKESQLIPLFNGVTALLEGFLPDEIEKLKTKQAKENDENKALNPSSLPTASPVIEKITQSEKPSISIKLVPQDSSVTISPSQDSTIKAT